MTTGSKQAGFTVQQPAVVPDQAAKSRKLNKKNQNMTELFSALDRALTNARMHSMYNIFTVKHVQ